MFQVKIFALFLALLGLVNFTVATPPACLLDVMGGQPDPSDLKTICNDKSIASDIADTCDSNKTAALSAYASACKEAGYTAATSVASSTSTKSASSSASATGSVTTPGSSTSTPGASASSGSDSASDAASTSGAATSTPAPSNKAHRDGATVGISIASVIAFFAIFMVL